MGTLWRDTNFLQIIGDTVRNSTGTVLSRGADLIPDGADFVSDPWAMYANGRFTIELDSTNTGGGVLAVTQPVIQRCSQPEARLFPGSAVVWTDVPVAEMTIAAIAAQNIQVLEFSASSSYVYRLSLPDADITNAGDLWVGVNVPRRFGQIR